MTINWAAFAIGVAAILAATLILHYLAEWLIALMRLAGIPINRWWKGYLLIHVGFLSGLVVAVCAKLLTEGVW